MGNLTAVGKFQTDCTFRAFRLQVPTVRLYLCKFQRYALKLRQDNASKENSLCAGSLLP